MTGTNTYISINFSLIFFLVKNIFVFSHLKHFLYPFAQVTYSFCKEFLQVLLFHVGQDGELCVTEVMRRIFEKSGKARYVTLLLLLLMMLLLLLLLLVLMFLLFLLFFMMMFSCCCCCFCCCCCCFVVVVVVVVVVIDDAKAFQCFLCCYGDINIIVLKSAINQGAGATFDWLFFDNSNRRKDLRQPSKL